LLPIFELVAVETDGGSSPPLDLAAEDVVGHQSVVNDRWLAVLWPAAILFHLAGNGTHLLAFDLIGALQFIMAVAAAVMLVRPRPLVAGALAGLFATVLWLKLPMVGNHEIILGLFSVAVGFSVLSARARWTEQVAPVGRWILLISYGFIAFSKLNRGFLDTVGSCAVLFADEFGRIVGLTPSNSPAVALAAIIATVLIEATIPVLLLSTRLRQLGVALALGFHLLLSLDPTSHIWDFSATLLPLFLLFAPEAFRQTLAHRCEALRRRPLRERSLVIGLVLAMQAVAMAGGLPFGGPTWTVAFPVWVVVAGAVVASYGQFLWSPKTATGVSVEPTQTRGLLGLGSLRAGLDGGPRSGVVTVGFSVLLACAVSNGLAPYLEVRSAAAFNMYSNLRVVDGDSNHLIVRRALSDAEPSYVTINAVDEGSGLQFYVDRNLMVPTENLDRHLAEHLDENPMIVLDGASVPARSAGYGEGTEGGVFASVTSVISHKLLFRRAVHQGDETACLRAWGPIG
jgi:hypothetical protein